MRKKVYVGLPDPLTKGADRSIADEKPGGDEKQSGLGDDMLRDLLRGVGRFQPRGLAAGLLSPGGQGRG